MDPEQARQLVLTERQRLETLARERENEIGSDGENDSIGELSSVDQHPGDIGTETFEREKDFSLLEQLEAEINDLDAALKKIDEGRYGVCEIGGEPIEPERLEAMPGTRTCIKHAGAR
jgi:RNA polymerase-binding transcription factor DksA